MTAHESKAVRYCGGPGLGSAPRRGTSCEVDTFGRLSNTLSNLSEFVPHEFSIKVLRGVVMSQSGTYFAKDQLLVPSSPLRTYNYPVGYLQAQN